MSQAFQGCLPSAPPLGRCELRGVGGGGKGPCEDLPRAGGWAHPLQPTSPSYPAAMAQGCTPEAGTASDTFGGNASLPMNLDTNGFHQGPRLPLRSLQTTSERAGFCESHCHRAFSGVCSSWKSPASEGSRHHPPDAGGPAEGVATQMGPQGAGGWGRVLCKADSSALLHGWAVGPLAAGCPCASGHCGWLPLVLAPFH